MNTSLNGVPQKLIQRNLARNGFVELKRDSAWLNSLRTIFSSVAHELCFDRFSGKGRPTAFVFTNHNDINAYGDMEGKYGIIAMNAGSFYVLMDFFAALLSHPELFTSIGDPSKETARFNSLAISEQGIIVTDANEVVQLPRFAPKDNARARFATLVTNMTLEFMFLHEVSHIVSGHPIILNRELFSRSPLQAHSSTHQIWTEEELYYRHAMETRSDIDAALQQAIALGLRDSFIMQSAQLPESLEDRLFAFAVSVCTYFFITSPNAYGNPWPKRCSHPHPYLRLAEVSDFFAVFLAKSQSELTQAWFAGYIRALSSLVDAWSRIGMGSLRLSDYFEDMDQVSKITSRLQQSRSDLLKWEHYDLRSQRLLG